MVATGGREWRFGTCSNRGPPTLKRWAINTKLIHITEAEARTTTEHCTQIDIKPSEDRMPNHLAPS